MASEMKQVATRLANALRELAKCARDEDKYGGARMDDALIEADEALEEYASKRKS